jgi:hypothetical protein
MPPYRLWRAPEPPGGFLHREHRRWILAHTVLTLTFPLIRNVSAGAHAPSPLFVRLRGTTTVAVMDIPPPGSHVRQVPPASVRRRPAVIRREGALARVSGIDCSLHWPARATVEVIAALRGSACSQAWGHGAHAPSRITDATALEVLQGSLKPSEGLWTLRLAGARSLPRREGSRRRRPRPEARGGYAKWALPRWGRRGGRHQGQ